MTLGDRLRHEARLLVQSGGMKQSTYMVILRFSNKMDELTDVPDHVFDLDVLAEASRSVNVARNGHPMVPWAEIVDDPQQEHVVEIWRKRAVVLQEEINAAIERRQT